MVERQLDRFFAGEGYTAIPSNLPEFKIYYRMESTYVNVFHVIYYRQGLYISKDQYLHIKEKIKELFLEKGISQIHILSLIICGDGAKARQLSMDDAMCWILDPYENRLMVFENQVSDFYGMKNRIEDFLAHLEQKDAQEEMAGEGFQPETGQKTYKAPVVAPDGENAVSYEITQKTYKVPVVTASLVAVNILVFILCTFTGDLLYNIGAIGVEEFVWKKEYYRIFTSMFLHWDINHLVSNMLVLYYLGEVVEGQFGPVRYGILYLEAGIGGDLLSIVCKFYLGPTSHSVGASGAVFGVIGALIVLVISHKGHLGEISAGRLVFMVAYSLYSGFVGINIDNAAHIGGFLSGMAIAFAYWLYDRLKTGKTA